MSDDEVVGELGGGALHERVGADVMVGCTFELSDGTQLLVFAGPSHEGSFEGHVRNNSAFSVNTVSLGASEPLAGGTLQAFCGERSDGEECFASWYDGDIEIVAHGSAVPGDGAAGWMRSHIDAVLTTLDAFDPADSGS